VLRVRQSFLLLLTVFTLSLFWIFVQRVESAKAQILHFDSRQFKSLTEDCPPASDSWDGYTPIGMIQGASFTSPCVDREVSIRGIVTGIREDQNVEGIRYYTFFLQDRPGFEDADTTTSDGIAVFTGQALPEISPGDLVNVIGTVQEYYGLTEINNWGLQVTVQGQGLDLPDPIPLNPPSDNVDSALYFEAIEGMLVHTGSTTVIGPTHPGCGFAVISSARPESRVVARNELYPIGQVINVIYATDVNCDDLPLLSVGDTVDGIKGPLTYEFDQYKVVHQTENDLAANMVSHTPAIADNQPDSSTSIATFNLKDFPGDPQAIYSTAQSRKNQESIKKWKIEYAISQILHCPTILALQEIHSEAALLLLANELAAPCNFLYEVTHIDGPDSRGISNALLTNSEKVLVNSKSLQQTCGSVITEVVDPSANCSPGEWPLFSRPPLEIELEVAGKALTIYVNHFKSKRGGVVETEPLRLAQATFLRQLVKEQAELNPENLVIVLGDFNDFENSDTANVLDGDGFLINLLSRMPIESRYSYNFGGVSQLVDWILVSNDQMADLVDVSIAHINSDYPSEWANYIDASRIGFRSSDHDIPLVTIQFEQFSSDEEASQTPTPTTQNDLVVVSEPAPTNTPRIIAEEPPSAAEMDKEKITDTAGFNLVTASVIKASAIAVGLLILIVLIWRVRKRSF